MPRSPEDLPCGWTKHLGKRHLVPAAPADRMDQRGSTLQSFPDSYLQINEQNNVVVSSPSVWGSLFSNRRRLALEVWRKSTNANDLADGCERADANIVYPCLLVCFQSAVAWKAQIILEKVKNYNRKELHTTVHCLTFHSVLLFFWLLLCILCLWYHPHPPASVFKRSCPGLVPSLTWILLTVFNFNYSSIQMATHAAQQTMLSSRVYPGLQVLALDCQPDAS